MVEFYKKGLPYKVDYERLDKEFSVPKGLPEPGNYIPRADLEKALGYDMTSPRFYTVVKGWCSRLFREWNVLASTEHLQELGVEIATQGRRLEIGDKGQGRAKRQIGKSLRVYNSIDRAELDEPGQRKLDHRIKEVGVLYGMHKNLQKYLAPPKAVESNPKQEVSDEVA